MTLHCALRAAAIATVLASSGCAAGRLQLRSTPHQKYAAMLASAGLADTALGQQWKEAGESALRSAVTVPTPFREAGYFPPQRPTAAGYRLELVRGRRLAVDITFQTVGTSRLFVDLFRVEPPDGYRLVASLAPSDTALIYDVERSATFVLRVQSELLQGGRYTLTERTLASLSFPVPQVTSRAVQSLFGASRDAGAREHEGVDIFAPRGTEVVAVANGLARTDTNTLGGNVVWLTTGFGSRRYYYAHLDRWAIAGTSRVQAGDVLGYVGNTGNARSTSPHLHFGIYDGGALDPLPFLRPDDPVPAGSDDERLLGERVRVVAARTAVLEAPVASAPRRRLIERESIGYVLGSAGSWRRLRLPDGTSGFVTAADLERADGTLRRSTPRVPMPLYELPDATTPVVETVPAGEAMEVLGRFGDYQLMRTAEGLEGWSRTSADRL